MRNKNSLIILGSILASIAAIIPMASYAATDTANVTVSVQPSISIDASAGTGEVAATTGKVTDSTIKATITSNQAYTISLSAAEPRLIRQGATNPGTDEYIPSISNVTDGQNGWGIKKKNSDGTDQANYSAVTALPVVFYTSATGALGAQTVFTVGIGTTAELASGTYQTDVTITAATTQSN